MRVILLIASTMMLLSCETAQRAQKYVCDNKETIVETINRVCPFVNPIPPAPTT